MDYPCSQVQSHLVLLKKNPWIFLFFAGEIHPFGAVAQGSACYSAGLGALRETWRLGHGGPGVAIPWVFHGEKPVAMWVLTYKSYNIL